MSASDAIERAPRLAGTPLLVAFAAVLVALLAIVFPTGREYAALTSETKPDAYSIAYLDVLTRANPKELDLRLVYARQLATLGRYDDAFAVLGPILEDPRLGGEGKQFALDVDLARARAIPEGDPRRDAAFVQVRARLRDLLGVPRTIERSEALAKLALEQDDPGLAADYYLDLATRQPRARATHLANAARWLRASGDNERAATLYRAAHDAAPTPVEAVEYAVLAVASLEADDKPAAAADLAAAFANEYPNDAVILASATRLATANSRAALARDLGRRLLLLMPDDEGVMRDQAQRELATGGAKPSLLLLNKLLLRFPDDYSLHLQRARVAEWAGDLDTAERDLIWLLTHRGAARQ